MKHCLLLGFFLMPLLVRAQDEAQQITLPASPAFSILNFEPSAVMKPTGTRELATDVLSAFDPQGKLMMNLGLEVSPYWLSSRPGLSQETYIRPKPGQTILQTLSLSAATAKDSATGDNNLGAGFRFRILNGQPVDSLEDARQALQQYNQLQSLIAAAASLAGSIIQTRQALRQWVEQNAGKQQIDTALIQQFSEAAEQLLPDFQDQKDALKKFAAALQAKLAAHNEARKQTVSRLLYQRKGFVLEFAGAAGFHLRPQHAWERIGLWSTGSYYVSRSDLFSATARFMSRNSDTLLYNFDFGFAYLKSGPRYNLSIEGMLRGYWWQAYQMRGQERIQIKDKGFSYRLAAQASYKLMKELSVNLSFGKDFENETHTNSGIFSILGFNYSLFAKRITE